jgi:hypothetical protein
MSRFALVFDGEHVASRMGSAWIGVNPQEHNGTGARAKPRPAHTGETRAYWVPAGFGGPFVLPTEIEKGPYFPAFPPFSTGQKSG